MPGRHVRFSTENTYYSPQLKPTSLPQSSPPSSTRYGGPRRAHTLSAPSHRHQAVAHRAMAYDEHPLLHYDLTLSPSTMTSHTSQLPASVLYEPATYPPQSTLVLASSHLPYAISISASAQTGFVTVADVLSGLYTALRAHVSREEYEKLGSATAMRRVRDAYAARYMRLRGHRGYEEEKAGGLRRVDLLMGHTRFRGLSPPSSSYYPSSPGQPEVWRFHTA
ncbi:hypothetical protein MIND_00638500 [Mycena indigotica]|uniref:DUF6699 domain-containing protein n=1 Tax=Mycena indigotica TaxID=2126181 RepID=A0A8H6SQB4_9AGAR|nr:uncharacterized protein MIND_00638500 [Mycena indigotica]KAF7304070.1 hypothetical protein MIND_00638500 [Mycena indigotica]